MLMRCPLAMLRADCAAGKRLLIMTSGKGSGQEGAARDDPWRCARFLSDHGKWDTCGV